LPAIFSFTAGVCPLKNIEKLRYLQYLNLENNRLVKLPLTSTLFQMAFFNTLIVSYLQFFASPDLGDANKNVLILRYVYTQKEKPFRHYKHSCSR